MTVFTCVRGTFVVPLCFSFIFLFYFLFLFPFLLWLAKNLKYVFYFETLKDVMCEKTRN